MTLIDTTGLTKIGDMTSGGGLTAAVNTGDGGSTGYKTGTTGWAGVALAAPTAISHVDVTSATNGFDASGSTSQITLKLYGRQGTAPAHATNGVLLGTVGPFTDVNATTVKTIPSGDTTTEWDYLWVTGTTGVWTVYESIKPYAADEAPPEEAPIQVLSERYTIRSWCDTPLLLGHQLTHLPDFDQTIFVQTSDALAEFFFRADIVHRGTVTGYNGALSLGCALYFKESQTFSELDGEPWQLIDRAVSGRNLCERNPQHYEAIDVTGALMLMSDYYYRFGVKMNAKTDQSPYQTTDGLAGILVEGNDGLNQFLVRVDHGGTLV